MGIEIAFQFDQDGSQERLNWIGWLSSAALDNTMKTLVDVLGYNGNDSINDDGVLSDPIAFKWDQLVTVVIEHETNPNNGKSYPKIKWVNSIGGSGFAHCNVETIKNDLNAVGFKAAFLAAKQGSTAKQQSAPAVKDPFNEGAGVNGKLPF